MANPNPVEARRVKKSRRKPGDLPALQRKLWGAILHAENTLEAAAMEKDPELTLKAVHALSQCAGQYAKLLEVGELEARVFSLEQRARGAINGVA
jgi:hypothetical protein|tara:strand:- start:87 stop:371 length:285 start_codon:yes stop_codon:yes gene_type:complete